MSDYARFLETKRCADPMTGFECGDLHPRLFPFQRDIVAWALRRGRSAIFAGTGLGKTLMQLAWADQIRRRSVSVLILTPLAVAHQTVKEAVSFGIDDVSYAEGGASCDRITVTNYERFDKFDVSNFGAIVLDESSIIKSHDSKTRAVLIAACRDVPFKLACTATPAPNDWIELGNHSEFLGGLTEKEMLATFFVHDGAVRAAGASEWRLKSHATDAFWAWVASWGAMVRNPSDLGYDDGPFTLPPLIKHQITVAAPDAPSFDHGLFKVEARTMSERLGARRDTIDVRARAAADIVNAQPDRPWLIWCNLNAEAVALRRLIPDAVEVRGTDDPDMKVKRLLGFVGGDPRVMLTKSKIAGMGMNWQHCADMVFVGLTDSFEQVFQAIRRCWRFGQTRAVNAYFVAADTEGAVVRNIDAKERDFEIMGESMAKHMRDLVRANVRGEDRSLRYNPTKAMELPAWLSQAQ